MAFLAVPLLATDAARALLLSVEVTLYTLVDDYCSLSLVLMYLCVFQILVVFPGPPLHMIHVKARNGLIKACVPTILPYFTP